jgi:hypothetical protein
MADIEKAPFAGHPNRCGAMAGKNQCPNLSVKLDEEGDYGTRCLAHGGNKQKQSAEKKSIRNYRLTRWQGLLERHAGSPQIKSLRDEVGLARMLLETRLNQIEDAQGLMLQSHTISDLLNRIERLVVSCQKVESMTGQMLDKQDVAELGSKIIAIIYAHIDDAQILDAISKDILELVTSDAEE